jgi:replicative DNA helicase
VDPSQIDRVSALIRDRDFVDPHYRNVYRALLVMRENRIPTDDLAILVRHLKGTGLQITEIADGRALSERDGLTGTTTLRTLYSRFAS